MLEHVGAPNFQTYFDTVKRLLADDGGAVIHSIGRMSGPGSTNAFTQKYIFPGGYIPGLSEIVRAVEAAGLLDHRHRDPAPALRRDLQALAHAVPG